MKLLQELNEEYRLFNITDDGIEEIDIDELLADDEESTDFDDSEMDTDTMDSELDLDDLDNEDTYNLGNGNYNYNMQPNTGGADAYDDLDSDEETKGEVALDSDLTGLDFSDEMENSDEMDDGDIPDFNDIGNENYITDDMDMSDEDYDAYVSGGDLLKQGSMDDIGNDESMGDESDEMDFDSGEMGDEDMEDMGDDMEGEEDEDPDFQGTIRTVKGACLVYKRRDEGTNLYTELWAYTMDKNDAQHVNKARRAILAGTDIKPNTNYNDEGTQSCEQTNAGNVIFLKISGLEN